MFYLVLDLPHWDTRASSNLITFKSNPTLLGSDPTTPNSTNPFDDNEEDLKEDKSTNPFGEDNDNEGLN